ncbi:MAG: 30S ribosomal protein S4e [Candidatus Woesearchaeota archaeon]
MVKNHLLRLDAPKAWPIARKGSVYLPKTRAGAHGFQESVPLSLVLREMLKLSRTLKETKALINSGKILINSKVRKDHKFAVGLMDVISIPEIGKQYRMLINYKGTMILHPISKEEAGLRLCKINGKTIIKSGKIQLNLHDGSNIITENKDYKPGDTIMLLTDSGEIKEHFKFEKGATLLITGGKKAASFGRMESAKSFKGSQPENIILSTKKGMIETRKTYAFVIGKEKASISLPQDE